jgi:cell division protein FtsQ
MNGMGLSSERDQIEIVLSKPEELSSIIDGMVVKVGAGEYKEKLERLLELEEDIQSRQITVDYIDLRFANRVVVKPIKEVIR